MASHRPIVLIPDVGLARLPVGDTVVGASTEQLQHSWVDLLTSKHGSFGGTSAGSYTVGATYVFTRRVTITGIRFAWAGSASTTVRASLYRGTDGTKLATVDVGVSAGGIYVATFASPHLIAASDVAQYLACTIWQTAGSIYSLYTGGVGEAGVSAPFSVARSALVKENPGRYASGDAYPSSFTAGEFYAVEPVIDPTPA